MPGRQNTTPETSHCCTLLYASPSPQVGIGAQEAFKRLWPGSQAPKDFAMLPHRRHLLLRLQVETQTNRLKVTNSNFITCNGSTRRLPCLEATSQ